MPAKSSSWAKCAAMSTASDRVDIRSEGSLTGDVAAARISIEDGAFFKGGIDIRKGGQPQQKAMDSPFDLAQGRLRRLSLHETQ